MLYIKPFGTQSALHRLNGLNSDTINIELVGLGTALEVATAAIICPSQH